MVAMSTDKESDNLHFLYRIILKVPKLSIEGFSPELQGIFWVVGCPLFIIGVFFLNFVLLVLLPFPYNYAVDAFANLLIITFIARILVERRLRLEKALLNERGFKWDITKTAQEYVELLKKRKMAHEENVAN